jgi:hypothetical protein
MWALLAALGSLALAEECRGQETTRRLVRQADFVVAGTPETAETFWDESRRVIITRVKLRTHRYFKGRGEQIVAVETLGGTVGKIGMGVSHGANLRLGETVVLLLRRSRYGSHCVVWGGRQGAFPVRVTRSGKRLIGRGAGMSEENFADWIQAMGE